MNFKKITLQLSGATDYSDKESNSDFAGDAGTCLVSRKHSGDENGDTTCIFAKLIIPIDMEGQGVQEIVLYGARIVTVKESNSFVLCGGHEVITRRVHHGDENGETEYTIQGVYARLSSTQTYIPCVMDNIETVSNKESSNDAAIDGKVIIGRIHNGDENGTTQTVFANICVRFAK